MSSPLFIAMSKFFKFFFLEIHKTFFSHSYNMRHYNGQFPTSLTTSFKKKKFTAMFRYL